MSELERLRAEVEFLELREVSISTEIADLEERLVDLKDGYRVVNREADQAYTRLKEWEDATR